MSFAWRTAWVTGASSGIGRALALELARGGVRVAASARRTDELEVLAHEQPGIMPQPLDVTDRDAMARAAADIASSAGPIDLAIFNAGIGSLMTLDCFDAELAERTMAVNYQGLVNGIAAVLPGMREKGYGHIALVSSLAGYRGMRGGTAYAPSKAAAISLAECLKPEFDAAGLKISIVNPGFVDTPMTAKAKHPLPYVMPAETAARHILGQLAKSKFEIAFPWQMAGLVKFGRILPYALYFRMQPGIDQDKRKR